MKTPARLSLYGLALVGAFGAAFLVARAVVPDAAVQARTAAVAEGHGAHDGPTTAAGHGGHDESAQAATSLPGLSLSADGYRLGPVSAPGAVGEAGELRFSVLDAEGAPVLEFVEQHEQQLHLIVVREDGSEFRHVHPELDADGSWSLPWTWDAAGTYRVFADFVPAGTGQGLTLARSVSVAGELEPVPAVDEQRTAQSGEYDIALAGDLAGGASSTLSIEVTRDGEPVTALQPYLGAFGHLVVLRDGDLAYLHVHPEGGEPQPGQRSGPTVEFAAEAPTVGRYLLYFDFRIDDEIHTASFVLSTDAAAAGSEGGTEEDTEQSAHESAPADDHDDEHGH